jgi:hypothetical protein
MPGAGRTGPPDRLVRPSASKAPRGKGDAAALDRIEPVCEIPAR